MPTKFHSTVHQSMSAALESALDERAEAALVLSGASSVRVRVRVCVFARVRARVLSSCQVLEC